MSFHVGGHKPRPHKSFRYGTIRRLLVAGGGAFLMAGGLYKFTHGNFEGTNYLHQPVYSTSLIVMGAAVALCALIPSSWLDCTIKSRRSRQSPRGSVAQNEPGRFGPRQ
jgi:hypothetical protein